jgi:hypothetical protein
MTEFLSRALAAILRGAARALPAERRQWAEAIGAEAASAPAGRAQAEWLAGGLWLIAKEANVVRRIGYGIGIVAVGAVVSWVLWLSFRAAPAADVEATTDRARVLVGVSAMLVLPWVGRRRGLFGPVGDSLAARLVRISTLAALCAVGIWLVGLDRRSNVNSVVGSGHFNWLQEAGGLALICAILMFTVLAGPRVVQARWPRADPAMAWMITAMAAMVAFFVAPFQTVAVGYVAAVLAATARRSPVIPAALAAGPLCGLAAGSAVFGLTAINMSESTGMFVALIVAPLVTGTLAAPAGAVAAWRAAAIEDPREFRFAQDKQGMLAGLAAGATTGLFLMTIASFPGMLLMITGPVVGLLGGVTGATFAARHPRAPRSGSFQAGVYTSSS